MRVINGLVTQGIEVITDRTHLVHVSGHPRRAELEDMIGWVRPQILIPVHGEALHMAEHGALARRAGVGKVVLCRNGDLVRLAPGDPGIIDEVPAGPPLQGRRAAGRRARRARSPTVAGSASSASSRSRSQSPSAARSSAILELELTGIPETDGDGNLIARRRLRRRAGGHRVDAAAAPARSRCGRRSGPARRARGHRRGLAQEADMPCPGADGMTAGSRACTNGRVQKARSEA